MLAFVLILLLYFGGGAGYQLHPEDRPVHRIEAVAPDMTPRNVSTCAVQLQRISNGELAFQYFEDGGIHFFKNHYLFDELVSDIGEIVWETSPAGHLHLLTFKSLPHHPFYTYLREGVEVPKVVANVSLKEELYYQLKAKEAAQYAEYRNWKPGDPFIQISLPPARDPRVPGNYEQSRPYALRGHVYNCISLEYKTKTQTDLGRRCMPPETGMRPLLREQHSVFNMLSAGKMFVNYTGSYIYPECGVTTDQEYGNGNTAPTKYFIQLLEADTANTTYPGKSGFIDRVTSRVWVVDFYSDWGGLASVHGSQIMYLNGRGYVSGPWAENCYHSLRMVGNPFMHEVGHNGGGAHGHGVGSTAPFHHFIANHRAGERDGCGTFSYMASGGYPFYTSAQSASHYYNSWETILPRWRRVLKYWNDGIVPEATLLGKERRLPHGTGRGDIGVHYFRIMDVEHQYSYKFLGADEDAYRNITFANYSLNPVFSSLIRNDQQTWIGFNDGFDPEDIILGLKRKDHVLIVEVYLDKAGFYSGMNSDFLSVLIEYRSNTRMSWNSHSIHFQSMRPYDFESNLPVNILNACVEKNHNDVELAGQGVGSPLPGRLWTCPDCDIGTFQLMVIDGGYANVDPDNFTKFNENRHENILDMPYRNIVINYTPNSRPNPAPTPKFYPLRFMQSPGVHCCVKDANVGSDLGHNITCTALLRVFNNAVHMISNYFINDPYGGMIRQYADTYGYYSTYRTLSTGAINFLSNVNMDADNPNRDTSRMTKIGGVTSTDGYFVHGGVVTNASAVGSKISDFDYMDEFYDCNITASIRPSNTEVYSLLTRGPTNFTNRIGWSWRNDRRRSMAEKMNNGYIIMFDAVWNPALYYIADTYPTDYFKDNTRAEMYYLAFPYLHTNAQCGYNGYYYSFDGTTNKASKLGRAKSTQILMNSKDRVLMMNLSYADQTFTLAPDGFSLEGTGCWAHQNRPTLYHANQWHMIYNPGPSRRNWLLVFDFDSEIPDNLVLFTDSYNSTDAIDLRMLSLVNKMTNADKANDRTIYWSYAVDNYAVLHEFYYRYEHTGGNPGLRFAFNKDVRLVNVRFVTPLFGTFQDIRNNGGMNDCGKFTKPIRTQIEDRTANPLVGAHVNPFSITLNKIKYDFENKSSTFEVPFPIQMVGGKFVPPAKIEYYDPRRPKCSDGQYAWRNQTGKYQCIACPAGYFCTEGIMNPCPAGYYTSTTGQKECTLYMTALSGHKFNEIPADAFYENIDYSKVPIRNPDGTVTGFYDCPGNQFKINGVCKPCPTTGYICVPGMDAVICPKGFRCGGGFAQPCVGDEYQDEEGQERCKTYTTRGQRLTCGSGLYDIPLDGSYPLFRTNAAYGLLILHLMDAPNAGCRTCPVGYKCTASNAVEKCAYNEYSPEGQADCKKCPDGEVRNADGSGCVSLAPVSEATVDLTPSYRFYGFYPTYAPPRDGKPVFPPEDWPRNRIHLHELHRVTHVVDEVQTVAEARTAVSSARTANALAGALLAVGGAAGLGLVGVGLRAALSKR